MPKHALGMLGYKRSKNVSTSMNALRFVVEFGHCADVLGHRPKIEEYSEHVGIARAQGFRRQRAFVECFPNDDVLDMWAVVKPLLDASGFAASPPQLQAVFIASLVVDTRRKGEG